MFTSAASAQKWTEQTGSAQESQDPADYRACFSEFGKLSSSFQTDNFTGSENQLFKKILSVATHRST